MRGTLVALHIKHAPQSRSQGQVTSLFFSEGFDVLLQLGRHGRSGRSSKSHLIVFLFTPPGPKLKIL